MMNVPEALERWLSAYTDATEVAFRESDVTPLLAYVRLPLIFVQPSASPSRSTLSQHSSRDGPPGSTQRQASFDHERLDASGYQPLGEHAGTIDETWTRINAGGEAYERLEAIYVVLDTDDGWRLTTVIQKRVEPIEG